MDDRRMRLGRARLYFICAIDALAALRPALAGGVDVFQLRDKHADDDTLLAAATTAREMCASAGALFILNDRPDLALEARADGVHLGQDDMALDRARELVGPDLLLGRSTHTPGQVNGATGADYIGVGPVHATPTKQGRPAVGLGLVRYAARRATTPFFAVGGLDGATVGAVVAAGADRVAVVRAISEAHDPRSAARALRAALRSEHPVG